VLPSAVVLSNILISYCSVVESQGCILSACISGDTIASALKVFHARIAGVTCERLFYSGEFKMLLRERTRVYIYI